MKKILLLAIVFISARAFAQSEGPNSPSFATYSAIGCLACPGAEWSNWTNITMADGNYANVSLNSFPVCFQTACYYSRFLMASYFYFNIPAAATITGVKAEMLRMSGTSPNVKDTIVQISVPNGGFGSNHADSSAWTPSLTNITYGDSTDVWGLVLTPDTVNNSDFGFRIMIRNGSPVVAAAPSSVDHIKMTVYYLLPTGIFSQTRTANEITVSPNPVTNQFTVYDLRSTISKIEIHNMMGKIVLSSQTSNLKSQISVDVSQLPPGIYFAFMDAGKEKITRKFVVQR